MFKHPTHKQDDPRAEPSHISGALINILLFDDLMASSFKQANKQSDANRLPIVNIWQPCKGSKDKPVVKFVDDPAPAESSVEEHYAEYG